MWTAQRLLVIDETVFSRTQAADQHTPSTARKKNIPLIRQIRDRVGPLDWESSGTWNSQSILAFEVPLGAGCGASSALPCSFLAAYF